MASIGSVTLDTLTGWVAAPAPDGVVVVSASGAADAVVTRPLRVRSGSLRGEVVSSTATLASFAGLVGTSVAVVADQWSGQCFVREVTIQTAQAALLDGVAALHVVAEFAVERFS